MATLKLSAEELEIIRQDEADFITDTYSKDPTVQRLRPSHTARIINNDEVTYNYIRDTLDVIVPLANKNGTPITLNLIAAALGYNKNMLHTYLQGFRNTSFTNQAEQEWFDTIQTYIRDTLAIARVDVESMQLSRRIDANSAAKAITEIDSILEEQQETGSQTIAVKLVDDLGE